jgi:hypothetical protein
MMELELKNLEDTISSIHEEMFYLRERYMICLKNTKEKAITFSP